MISSAAFNEVADEGRIVGPHGTPIVPTSKPQPDGTLVKALARAWRWWRQLDEGAYGSVSDIGETEGISKSYVSRILRLAMLAPDIVDGNLAGSTDQALMLEQLERPPPVDWAERRNLLAASTEVALVKPERHFAVDHMADRCPVLASRARPRAPRAKLSSVSHAPGSVGA